jgi:hypothetical protein
VARPVQDFLRQDQPIGGDDQHIERDRDQCGAGSGVTQRRRLRDGEGTFLCQRLHWRGRLSQASAMWPIGLRQHQRYRISGGGNGGQRARGEQRRAGKADPQR